MREQENRWSQHRPQCWVILALRAVWITSPMGRGKKSKLTYWTLHSKLQLDWVKLCRVKQRHRLTTRMERETQPLCLPPSIYSAIPHVCCEWSLWIISCETTKSIPYLSSNSMIKDSEEITSCEYRHMMKIWFSKLTLNIREMRLCKCFFSPFKQVRFAPGHHMKTLCCSK